MSINGIIGTENINQTHMIKKEFLILNNWIEFCQNDVVGIPKNLILTISSPDKFIKDAYDLQKEHEDVGYGSYKSINNNEESTDISDIINHLNTDINDIINEIISGNLSYSDEEENWSDDEVDKGRQDYGNDMDDWSPYCDDYFDNQ